MRPKVRATLRPPGSNFRLVGVVGGLHPRLTEGESGEKVMSKVSGKAGAGEPGFLPLRQPWAAKRGPTYRPFMLAFIKGLCHANYCVNLRLFI